MENLDEERKGGNGRDGHAATTNFVSFFGVYALIPHPTRQERSLATLHADAHIHVIATPTYVALIN